MNTIPTPIPCDLQELTKHDKYFEEAEHDQQQRKEPTNQVQQSKGKDVQTVNRVAESPQ